MRARANKTEQIGALDVVIHVKLEDPYLDTSYRRGFLSFIKCILSKYDKRLYKSLYGQRFIKDNPFKPISFNVYFPELQKDKNSLGHILVGTIAELRIRTYDIETGIRIYNAARQFKKNGLVHIMYHNKAYIDSVSFELVRPITQKQVVFKTLAPIVLEKRIGDKEFCITPDSPEFNEAFMHYINICTEHLINVKNVDQYVRFDIGDYKIVKIRHYENLLHAFHCEFFIQAPQPILNALYFAGIGAKRSQGFGMLKPIST